MMDKNELAVKRQQVEKVVKWVGGIGIILVAGTVAIAVATSIVAVTVACITGLVAINVIPVAARRLASWKYNELRRDAIDNPIPNLMTRFEEEQARFKLQYDGVVKLNASTKDLQSKIEGYKQRGASTDVMMPMYENMKRALSVKTDALVNRNEELKALKVKIGEAQEMYNMALDLQSASDQLESASVEMPIQDKLLFNESLQAITTKLNTGFARTETAMALDFNALPASAAAIKVL